MCFLGFSEGVKGYLFMRLHNNTLFTATTAIFDEVMMPKCPTSDKRQFTPVGEDPPRDNQIPSINGEPPIPKEADDDEDPHHRRRSPTPEQRDDAGNPDVDEPAPSLPHTPPRRQEQLPPASRQLPPPPRKSQHEQRIPLKPGNVYGDQQKPIEVE